MAIPDEQLSRSDASNLQLDVGDQVNCFLVAGLLASDTPGPAVDLTLLRDQIAARLAAQPVALRRFAQCLSRSDGAPVWRVCAPDLTHHVREVPAVSGPDGLAGLTAALMTRPLPLDRPLWELLIVPGASATATGIVLRLHHCVADGAGGVALAQVLLSDIDAGSDTASAPQRPTGSASSRPGDSRASSRCGWTSLRRLAAMVTTRLGPTVLLGRISETRTVAFAQAPMAGLALAARAAGGTINDALMAAVAAALPAALTQTGRPVPRRLPISIPVALPERGTSGNAVGVMVVDLPAAGLEPAARIAALAAITHAAKAAAREQGTYELTRTRWGTTLFGLLARHQRFVAAFVTNVKGPAMPLQIAGHRLERLWPVTPIQGNVRVGIAALSYAGQLACAVHTDPQAVDAAILGPALQRELDRIVGSVDADLTTA